MWVALAVARGATIDALLARSEIPPGSLESPDARICYEQLAWLARYGLRLTGDPGLVVEFGRRIHVNKLGMLGVLMANSATVDEALRAAIAHHRTLAPIIDMVVQREGARATLRWRLALPLATYHVFGIEMLLGELPKGTYRPPLMRAA